jgi:hypothetical protein
MTDDLFDKADKNGNPITLAEWARLFADLDYRRVGSDEIGPLWISTVWLGLNHGAHSPEYGPALYFETMIFDHSREEVSAFGPFNPTLDFQMRYTTLAQAERAHKLIVDFVARMMTDGATVAQLNDALNKGLELA